jgi:hypothetical protein
MRSVYLRRPHFGADHTAPSGSEIAVTRTTALDAVLALVHA